MAITRTTDTDDDGTGTTGTIHNNAWLQAIFAAIESGWALDSYTPTWTATGSNPAIGNGTITGKYISLGGKCVVFGVRIVMGSTTTFGTGNYVVTLPLTADTNYAGAMLVLAADTSAVTNYNGRAFALSTTTMSLITTDAAAAAPYTPTVPFTFANTDVIGIFGVYFRA